LAVCRDKILPSTVRFEIEARPNFVIAFALALETATRIQKGPFQARREVRHYATAGEF
jgi:hypothetical protein